MEKRIRMETIAGGLAACAFMVVAAFPAQSAERGEPWTRHAIDDSSRGADGVRLDDVNADGLQDVVTAWEEGGAIRLYINPGPSKAKEKWPAVTVGEVKSPEDAVLADLDADGNMDVVSCCEGETKTIYFHWGPKDQKQIMNPDAWKTEALPASEGAMMWMFCAPAELDRENTVDLVAGGKGEGAQLGWFASPQNPRDVSAWKWYPMREMGWTMTIRLLDLDEDGDRDILASDRKGSKRGIFWLRNPSPRALQTEPWNEIFIGGDDREVMFIDPFEPLNMVFAATRGKELLCYAGWEDPKFLYTFSLPENTGTAKAVALGRIDNNDSVDLVFTCENAKGKSGVMWMSADMSLNESQWTGHEISGPEGTKFDRIELIDLDNDGDLDVMTCEEAENLGVIWYENPGVGTP